MPRVLLLTMALAVAACSGSEPVATSTPAQADPAAVAAEWLQAAATGDAAALARLVEPRGLAVIAGVESNLRSDELVALLESGMSDALRSEYWSQFRDDFALFSGIALSDLAVGEPLALATSGFTAVALDGGDGSGRVILRETDAGWQVDFPGTIGPSLIGPLSQYLDSAVDGASGEVIAAAYRDFVAPGLDAALSLDPANTRLQFEAEYIRQLAESATP
ncbi:MAG: hypothetical protein QNJ75_06075 [Acidimicrobiia bacterium]|nr:hypothetical protein [Acidimicrobiia bacterium]